VVLALSVIALGEKHAGAEHAKPAQKDASRAPSAPASAAASSPEPAPAAGSSAPGATPAPPAAAAENEPEEWSPTVDRARSVAEAPAPSPSPSDTAAPAVHPEAAQKAAPPHADGAPAAAPPSTDAAEKLPPQHDRRFLGLSLPAFLALGAGGLGAGGALVTHMAASTPYSDPRLGCSGPCSDRPHNLALASNVLTGFAAAALGTGLVLAFFDNHHPQPALRPQLKLSLGPRKAGASAAWSF
jgi:hypothetical protein